MTSSTARRLMTGSVPGSPMQIGHTRVFGSSVTSLRRCRGAAAEHLRGRSAAARGPRCRSPSRSAFALSIAMAPIVEALCCAPMKIGEWDTLGRARQLLQRSAGGDGRHRVRDARRGQPRHRPAAHPRRDRSWPHGLPLRAGDLGSRGPVDPARPAPPMAEHPRPAPADRCADRRVDRHDPVGVEARGRGPQDRADRGEPTRAKPEIDAVLALARACLHAG